MEATAAASFEENAGAPPVGYLEEVVMLDVRGMHCGGCASNVRRVLEAEGSCVSAAVNLANESALVRVGVDVDEAAVAGRADQDAGFEDAVVRAVRAVGDALAEKVTEKGFPTTVREACGVAVAGVERRGRRGVETRGAAASHRGEHATRGGGVGAGGDVPDWTRGARVSSLGAVAQGFLLDARARGALRVRATRTRA